MIFWSNFVLIFCCMEVMGVPRPSNITHVIKSSITSSVWTAESSWPRKRPLVSDDKIYFPNESKEDVTIPPIPRLKITPCPNGQTFCEDDDNYPSSYLRQLPQQVFERFNSFFSNDSITQGENELSTRIDGHEEQSLCLSKEEIIFPRKAQGIDKETKLIVNTDNYLQGIRVETCSSPGLPCLFKDTFPNGYTTVCRQKYTSRKMVTLKNGNSNSPLVTSEFLFPSCCVCKTVQTSLDT